MALFGSLSLPYSSQFRLIFGFFSAKIFQESIGKQSYLLITTTFHTKMFFMCGPRRSYYRSEYFFNICAKAREKTLFVTQRWSFLGGLFLQKSKRILSKFYLSKQSLTTFSLNAFSLNWIRVQKWAKNEPKVFAKN